MDFSDLNALDLSAEEIGADLLTVEQLQDGVALSTWATASTASSASCPTSTASSSASASSFG
jgi:hypothetical protein